MRNGITASGLKTTVYVSAPGVVCAGFLRIYIAYRGYSRPIQERNIIKKAAPNDAALGWVYSDDVFVQLDL